VVYHSNHFELYLQTEFFQLHNDDGLYSNTYNPSEDTLLRIFFHFYLFVHFDYFTSQPAYNIDQEIFPLTL